MILWSWVGAFLGIYLVNIICQLIFNDSYNVVIIVGSLGASAVLIYAAPQAEYSQPRNLVGGHIISALIGVSFYQYIPLDIPILGALTVATSISAMQLTKTIHPPGGATALIAVIGGSEIHQLGYYYVLTPILSGVTIMLIVALIVNNLSKNPKLHYPKYWL